VGPIKKKRKNSALFQNSLFSRFEYFCANKNCKQPEKLKSKPALVEITVTIPIFTPKKRKHATKIINNPSKGPQEGGGGGGGDDTTIRVVGTGFFVGPPKGLK